MEIRRLYHKLSRSNPALAVLSGVLLGLAFPRPGWYALAWVALVPLLVAVRRSSLRGSIGLGMVTGSVFFAGLLYWIALFGFLPYLLLSIVQAAQVALFAALAHAVYRKRWYPVLAVPALWVTIEWMKSLGTFGLTWGGLAYSQAPWTHVIQIAGITGPWGVSFLVVLLNAALAGLLSEPTRQSRRDAVVAAVVVLSAAVGGAAFQHFSKPPRSMFRAAVVQGGVPLKWPDNSTLRRIVDAYWPATEQLRGKANLIVWPESALPGDLLAEPALYKAIQNLARTAQAEILTGGYHSVSDPFVPGGHREFNGAFLMSPEGRLIGSYYKVHLVPFSEFVPGRDWLPLVKNYRVLEVDRSAGPGYSTMKSRVGNIGTMICFESTFPQIARTFVKSGAGLLVAITNDSWFDLTAAAAQHHEFSVLRAVETHRYLVRAASTGISSTISPEGQVLETTELGKKAVITGEVGSLSVITPYVRFGDWFAYVCAALSLWAVVVGRKVKRAGQTC